MTSYRVIVGNMGTVYNGDSKTQALNDFHYYADQSMLGIGRASGESVTMFENGEIFKEHLGGLEGGEK
jgi:hypothetical protein